MKDFRWAREGETGEIRSDNAVLMDWADDITYATHDIEDYFRAGLIPLHNLRHDQERIAKHGIRRLHGLADFNEREFLRQLDSIARRFESGLDSGCWDTRKNRSAMNEITSENLTECVDAVRSIPDRPYVKVTAKQQYLVEALKELTWFYVIDRPPLAILQEGQKRLIGSLYDQLLKWLSSSPKSPRIPIQLRIIHHDIKHDKDSSDLFRASTKARCARAVADYICLLTEAQAIDLAQRLSGQSRSSMFGTWFS